MSNRRLSILLLIALFALTSFVSATEDEAYTPDDDGKPEIETQDIEEDFHPDEVEEDVSPSFQTASCAHDTQDKPEIEDQDIEEDWNPEGNDHSDRNLASYSNMRMYGYYGGLGSTSSANRNYLSTQLFPPILDYFSAALRVKYPVSGLWKTTAGSVCGMNTPSVLRSGVNADFVLFVVSDSSSSYVANTYTCTTASGSNRPLSGRTTVSTVFVAPTSDVLNHEKNMVCMIHEVTHALGFSTSLYGRFLNSNGQRLSGHLSSASLDGSTSVVLNVEPLTSRLRAHFGCSSLRGAYMENTGSSATAGSHFERRIFAHELMTSGLIYQQAVSQFSLALLEGSGWYVADYSMADGFWWGQGQGCSFLTGQCSAAKFDEFCSGGARACTNPGRGAGGCGSDGRSDGCQFIHANYGNDCDNGNARNNARLPSAETYGRGQNSKCFTGSLSTANNGGSSTTFCFKSSCSGSGSKTVLNVQIGGKNVACTQQGRVSVSGFGGTFNCPNPVDFCQTVGAKVCPRGCMGRGSCVNGVCQCRNGHKGVDCAL